MAIYDCGARELSSLFYKNYFVIYQVFILFSSIPKNNCLFYIEQEILILTVAAQKNKNLLQKVLVRESDK